MRAMSLDSYGKEEEDNEMNNLKLRLEFTNNIVINLSKQLDELKETVRTRFELSDRIIDMTKCNARPAFAFRCPRRERTTREST